MTSSKHQSEKEEAETIVSNIDAAEFYKKVGKMCFFFQINDHRQFKRIKDWLSNKVENVDVFVVLFGSGYIPKQQKLTKHFIVFSKKDFSFWGSKKERLEQWIDNHDFELLISFEPLLSKKSMKVMKSIRAKLKAGSGKSGQSKLYHLNIEYSKSMDYNDFFDWITKYFLELNIKL